jgi:hypothetical protein
VQLVVGRYALYGHAERQSSCNCDSKKCSSRWMCLSASAFDGTNPAKPWKCQSNNIRNT